MMVRINDRELMDRLGHVKQLFHRAIIEWEFVEFYRRMNVDLHSDLNSEQYEAVLIQVAGLDFAFRDSVRLKNPMHFRNQVELAEIALYTIAGINPE